MQLIRFTDFVYSNKLLRVGLHVLFWLALFGTKLYLTDISFNIYRDFDWTTKTVLNFNSTLLLAGFYYTLVYFLIPLIKKKKYLTGIAAILAVFIFYTSADTYTEFHFIRECKSCLQLLQQESPVYLEFMNTHFSNVVLKKVVSLGTALSVLLFLCIPLSIKMSIYALRSQVKALELSKDNLELEFNLLKAQLNPHFLFNSMNNIYGLILADQKHRSAELVARLSGLLRYFLYDSNEHTTAISKEIDLIGNYIELEQVRVNDIKINFELIQDNMPYQIAPLMLLPLIENAFKFCPDESGAKIDILLKLSEGQLELQLSNTTGPISTPTSIGGIGLNNLKKRLDLYYRGSHLLNFTITPACYQVNLRITL